MSISTSGSQGQSEGSEVESDTSRNEVARERNQTRKLRTVVNHKRVPELKMPLAAAKHQL